HSPELQERPWPPVRPFSAFAESFQRFLESSPAGQRSSLQRLREEPESHSEFLHRGLATVYAYILGYRDSPCYQRLDDEREGRLQSAKIVLERELLDGWLRPAELPRLDDRAEAVLYLRKLAGDNPGYHHPLFDYVESTASPQALRLFLWNEVI